MLRAVPAGVFLFEKENRSYMRLSDELNVSTEGAGEPWGESKLPNPDKLWLRQVLFNSGSSCHERRCQNEPPTVICGMLLPPASMFCEESSLNHSTSPARRRPVEDCVWLELLSRVC